MREEPPEGTPDGLIADRFRLEGLLGTGGSASVFEALDTATGEIVAVKLLHPHLAASAPLQEAFLAEAARAQKLRHPGLAAIRGVGVHDDGTGPIVWIAQDLAPGMTLGEHVRRSGPLSPAHAIAMADSVLDALSAAHAIGLVHRDVSPGNVMIDIQGGALVSTRLLDFGLADAPGRAARGGDVLLSSAPALESGVVANTRYASPEQLRGEPVSASGDLYQVGGTLYFALTGSPPYRHASSDELVRAHVHAPPPVPSVVARSVPPELDRIVVRAMLKDPADRFADAAAMRAALGAVPLAAVPLGAAPTAPTANAFPKAPTRAATAAVAIHGAEPSGPGATRLLPLDPTTPADDDDSTAPVSIGSGAWGWFLGVAALVLAALVVGPALFGSLAGRPAPTISASAVAAPSTLPPVATTTPSSTPAAAAVAVPVFGTLTEARAALAAAGLLVGDVQAVPSPSPGETVLSADPERGTFVRPGSSVALRIASGQNAIPSVEGMARDAAFAALQAAGFLPSELGVSVPGASGGIAVTTRPAPGSTLAVGSPVTVLVTIEAASTPAPSPSATGAAPTPSPGPRGSGQGAGGGG
jgi:serine/threonine-protein kinase